MASARIEDQKYWWYFYDEFNLTMRLSFRSGVSVSKIAGRCKSEAPNRGWQGYLSGPPVAALPEMLTKHVATRATTTTRSGCVRRGLGMPFSRRGRVSAAEDNRRLPKITEDPAYSSWTLMGSPQSRSASSSS